MLSREAIISEMKGRGYAVFENGDYNLNIVGLRRQPGTANAFDDLIVVFYKVGGAWAMECFPCTTDPGTYWLLNPSRVNGTAILCPGQYRSSHKVGYHHAGQPTQYPALVQNTPLQVWRDNNKDSVIDYAGPVLTDVQGLNIHHAGQNSTVIDKWSAACQVIASMSNWTRFWALIVEGSKRYGPTFTYTLLDWPYGF